MEKKDYRKKIEECIATAKNLHNLLTKEQDAKQSEWRLMSISHSDSKEDTHFQLRIELPEETFKGAFYVGDEVKGFQTKDGNHDEVMNQLMNLLMETIEFYQGYLGEDFNIIWLGD